MRKIFLCRFYDPCNPRVQSIKKEKVFQELRPELLSNVFDVLIGRMDDGRACLFINMHTIQFNLSVKMIKKTFFKIKWRSEQRKQPIKVRRFLPNCA